LSSIRYRQGALAKASLQFDIFRRPPPRTEGGAGPVAERGGQAGIIIKFRKFRKFR
jgi:hypothetical protein